MMRCTNDITRYQTAFPIATLVRLDPVVQNIFPYLTKCFMGTALRVATSNAEFTEVCTDKGVLIKEYTNWFIKDEKEIMK